MSKSKLKLSVSGILFLIAIVLLMGAMVAVIVVLSSNCAAKNPNRNASVPTAAPAAISTDEPAAPSDEPPAAVTPTDVPALEPIEPTTTESTSTETSGTVVIAPTPSSAAATPASSAKIYTKPSSAQKKAAKNGYIYKDKVNMRKGPGTNYDLVKKDIPKNTPVTLYEQQGDWWFLKCGDKYGYIRKDMIKTGSAPTAKATKTPKPKTTATPPPGSFIGTVKTNSVVAFRESPSTVGSKVICELKNGDKVIVYSKENGIGHSEWYYCEYNGRKGFIAAHLLKVPSGVPDNTVKD